MAIVDFDQARRDRENAMLSLNRADPLHGGRGGGTSDGMDGWQQSVETRLSDLGGDVRDLRRWFGGGVILLLGAFAAGFLALQAELRAHDAQARSDATAIDQRLDRMSESQARIETLLAERGPRSR